MQNAWVVIRFMALRGTRYLVKKAYDSMALLQRWF